MKHEKIRKQNQGVIYNTHAVQSLVPDKISTVHLPRGTTARFAEFALKCAVHDWPLNTLLTLRWHALFAEGADYRYLSLPPRDRIAKSVELFRHFLTYRDLKFVWIWAQEARTDSKGLHWHLAFHCPKSLHSDLLDYIEQHFGLDRLPKHLAQTPTNGELGRSEAHAWHLACDTCEEFSGLALALYLGKGEGHAVNGEGIFEAINNTDLSAFEKAKFECFTNAMLNRHFKFFQGTIEGKNKDRFAISRAQF